MTIVERSIIAGGAVKALGEGVIEGYLTRHTSRDKKDKHGEYFSARTNYGFDKGYAITNAFNLYHHGMGELGPIKIGRFTAFEVDAEGIKATAQLDMSNPAVPPIYAATQRGELHWSSGALPQSVRVESDGHIAQWYVIEGSLTRDPAEPDGTRVRVIKAANLGRPTDPTGDSDSGDAAALTTEGEQITHTQKESGMNPLDIIIAVLNKLGAKITGDEITSMLQDIRNVAGGDVAALEAATPDEAMMSAPPEPVMKAMTRINDLVTTRFNALNSAKAAGLLVGRLPVSTTTSSARDALNLQVGALGMNPLGAGGANPVKGAPAQIDNLAVKSKYGNLSPEEISFVLDSQIMIAKKEGERVMLGDGSESTMKAIYQVFAANALDKHGKGELTSVKSSGILRALHALKTNELDYTTQTGFGLEWVPTLWRNQLWERARRENRVLALLNQIELKAPVEEQPTESSDPTVYYVGEATDDADLNPSASKIPSSKLGTDKQTFSAKKLALRVGWSAEQNEDSIIAFAPTAQKKSLRAMSDAIDMVLLNGDTASSNNINLDGGSPAANLRYRIFDAIIKDALANGNKDALGVSVTLRLLRQTRFLLNREASSELDNIVAFIPPEMEASMLDMDEFVTMDKIGNGATALTGQIGRVDGVPVVISSQIALAASNGKVSSTPANNDFGRVVYVYRNYWNVAFLRQIRAKLIDTFDGEAWQLAMSTRLDIKQHTDGGGASILRDLAV